MLVKMCSDGDCLGFARWVLELDSAVLVVEGAVGSLIGGLPVKFPHMGYFSSSAWL